MVFLADISMSLPKGVLNISFKEGGEISKKRVEEKAAFSMKIFQKNGLN